MKRARVAISDEALADLTALASFIAQDSLVAAVRLHDAFMAQTERLSRSPRIGRPVITRDPLLGDVR